MSLSDDGIFDDETPRCFYWEEDIKKYIGGFLEKLKDSWKNVMMMSEREFLIRLDKLALEQFGKDLI